LHWYAPGNSLQHRKFALGEREAAGLGCQEMGGARANHRGAAEHLAYHVDDLGFRGILERHTMNTAPDQSIDDLGCSRSGKHDESRLGRPAPCFEKHFQPIRARHIVVEYCAVGVGLAYLNYGVDAVDGRSHDIDVFKGRQCAGKTPGHEPMIIGDQDLLPHAIPPVPRTRSGGYNWLLLLLAVVMALLATPVVAEDQNALVLTGPADIEMVGPHFEYLLDPDWRLVPEDFVGASRLRMQPIPSTVPDFGYTAARIWLRLDLVNGTADVDRWHFFAQANFTQQIAVYRVASDGTIDTLLNLTRESPFGDRTVDYPQMVAPFELEPGDAATILVSYYSQGSSRISMTVETADSFFALSRIQQAKNYAYYGMMLVLVAMASVALLVLRQAIFAAYAGYVLSLLVYVAHTDGVAFQYLWPGQPQFNSMASVVAGSSSMAFGALFAMLILQTRRYHPILHRIIGGLIVSVLIVDIALWATAPQLLKQFLVVMISVCALTFMTSSIIAARTRFRAVRFYLFAWLASLIPAALFTARYAFGFETTIITLYDTIRLALLFDALMMGLAVFDSYNQQRQAALEATLAHARRNLALGERLAVLEEQYESVKSTARQREESVKDTVHDLRQPMQALRLSLRQMFNPHAETALDIGQVETALTYMEKLVADRLVDDRAVPEATALPAGGHDTPPDGNEPRLHAVLRGIADMFAAEAQAKGLRLRLVLAAADADVRAYPLMRVLANLVSNAIKYTGDGRIVVALRRAGRGHRIEIHDTGPGLSGAEFEQALQRNERLDRDRSRAGGSGLGLAVVKEIVDSNGWRLDSCPDRRTGASIRLHLPMP
jgi:signal transduction histidine kinase